jgi:hypothetical protein
MSNGTSSPWEKVDDALKQLTEAIDSAFTTIGETLRDPDLREQLKGTANSLASAVTSTVRDVKEDVKERFGSKEDPRSST